MIALTLEAISETLKKMGFETLLQNKTKDFPADVLIVPIGVDDDEQSFVLQIQHSVQDLSKQELSDGLGQFKAVQNKPFSFLSFLMAFPYEIPEKSAHDVMRMLFIANKALPLQGLGYSEPEKSAYFLFTYPSTEHKISEETIYGILGTIGFVVDNVAPVVRDLVSHKTTISQLLSDEVV